VDHAGVEPPQHQASAAQLQQLQQATAAHDRDVATVLGSLPQLKRLAVTRCNGLAAAVSAALSDMGQLSHLTAAMPLLPRQLPGHWGGWAKPLATLEVRAARPCELPCEVCCMWSCSCIALPCESVLNSCVKFSTPESSAGGP
jgi:hypothetical protein